MTSSKMTRTINRSSAAIVAATVGVLVWGWFAGSQLAVINEGTFQSSRATMAESTAKSKSSPVGQSNAKPLTESSVWTRRLQSGFSVKASAPIVENVIPNIPVVSTPTATQTPKSMDLGLRLVGTVIEKGGSMAIAIDRVGKLDFCCEGSSLQLQPEGVRIESVSTDFVNVSFNGQSASWQMGQTLRFNTGTNEKTDLLPPSASKNSPPMKPKLSVVDELELINGTTSSAPF